MVSQILPEVANLQRTAGPAHLQEFENEQHLFNEFLRNFQLLQNCIVCPVFTMGNNIN